MKGMIVTRPACLPLGGIDGIRERRVRVPGPTHRHQHETDQHPTSRPDNSQRCSDIGRFDADSYGTEDAAEPTERQQDGEPDGVVPAKADREARRPRDESASDSSDTRHGNEEADVKRGCIRDDPRQPEDKRRR